MMLVDLCLGELPLWLLLRCVPTTIASVLAVSVVEVDEIDLLRLVATAGLMAKRAKLVVFELSGAAATAATENRAYRAGLDQSG